MKPTHVDNTHAAFAKGRVRPGWTSYEFGEPSILV